MLPRLEDVLRVPQWLGSLGTLVYATGETRVTDTACPSFDLPPNPSSLSRGNAVLVDSTADPDGQFGGRVDYLCVGIVVISIHSRSHSRPALRLRYSVEFVLLVGARPAEWVHRWDVTAEIALE
ncbi:MAG: hypothetical protein M3256_17700 [Actinomycetota bacterium]|nr:hypothetical protein [Actinomycetota bacterium]